MTGSTNETTGNLTRWQLPARLDPDVVARYNRRVPRYTSYPTAPHLTEDVDMERLLQLQGAAERERARLAFYVHVPYCRRKCLYCGCHSTVCEDIREVQRYRQLLLREVELTAQSLPPGRPTARVSFGGGSPSELGAESLKKILDSVFAHWPRAEHAEVAIELDPRSAGTHLLDALLELGFNRFSFGVQDFDQQVLERVGRPQPAALTRKAVAYLRRRSVHAETPVSINFDLLFGLPGQTSKTWTDTLSRVRELQPDRLSVFPYAHVPWIKPHQKALERWGLPGAEERLELFRISIEFLQDVGYAAVGMDHFARPADELAKAAARRTMYRDFMGYSPGPEPDLVGLGASAIWWASSTYSQNLTAVQSYAQALMEDKRPVWRGLIPSSEDLLRRDIIQELTCDFRLDTGAFEERLTKRFDEHFAAELEALAPLEQDGLIRWDGDVLTVTDLGRLFVRCVCQVFDQYMTEPAPEPKHSTAL